MSKPNADRVNSEIKALEAIKPTVLRYSKFGENHHDAIEAQIEVLKGGMDDTAEEYNELPDNVRGAADEAFAWLEGQSELESLADDWKSLVVK